MFLDESAFDVDDDVGGVPRLTSSATPKNQSGVGEIKSGRYNNSTDFSRPGTASRGGDDDDLGNTLGSAGSIGASSSSRARMLAQQREIQLKKRQASMQSGGMIRSSIDTDDDVRGSNNSQFTPAIRQFSAPKSVKETFSEDIPDEIHSPKRGGVSKSLSKRIPIDDDDDLVEKTFSRGQDRGPRGGRGGARDIDREEYPYERDGGRGGDRWGDDAPPRRGGRGGRGGRADDDYEDDYARAPPPRSGSRGGWDEPPARGAGRPGYRDDDYDRRAPDRAGSFRRGDDDYDDRRAPRGGYEDERDYDRRPARDPRGADRGPRGGRGRQDYDDYEFEDEYADRRGGRGPRRDPRDRDPRERDYDRDYDRDGRDERRSPSGRGGKWQELAHQRSGQLDEGGSMSRGMGGELDAPRAFTPPDLSDMRRFLQNPVPKSCGVVQCYIRRNKSGTNKLFPLYSLYLKEGDVFLMCSKKRPKNKTSNYLISKAEGDISKGGDHYMGKLRSNFVGTEFQVFDDGCSPNGQESGERTADHVRTELGSVMYAPNVLGSRGPRKMQVVIPCVDETNQMIKPKNPGGLPFQEGDYLQRMKDHSFRDLVYMINKPPRWNEQVQAYVLNFNGRVTMASVKNFQLVDPEEQNTVLLQFGRVGKDDFTMDMQWPFSPLQAFAVTLSSFDSKIACD